MNIQELRIIVGQIKQNVSCPKCKHNYNDEDLNLIGSLNEDSTFFHAFCSKCPAEAVINVSVNVDTLDNPSWPESIEAPLTHSIELNEVLDMHNFLDQFDGDFNTLFKAKK